MSRLQELGEKLDRYKRVFNEEAIKTLHEIDEELGLLQPSSLLIKAGLNPDVLLVLSGMRDYSNYLHGLVEKTQAQLEQEKQQEEIKDE